MYSNYYMKVNTMILHTLKLCIATLIQLITESFPISSSGHVKLFGDMIQSPIADAELYFLHGPTIIILAWFFAQTLVTVASSPVAMQIRHWPAYAPGHLC